MEHHFNVTIAQKYNINIATFLHNIAFWTQHNIANHKNFHGGLYWTYNSYEAFTILFPYWTYEQIRLIISKCVKEGLLVEGNFNRSKYDKTKWYALTEKGLELFGLSCIPCVQVNKTLICENPQIEDVEKPDGSVRKARPIPDSKPDGNPITKTAVVVDDQIFSLKLQNEFLALRLECGDDEDERSDYEFLEQCRFHLENNTGTKFNIKQKIKGLKSIIKLGFIPPPEYLEMIQKIKQKKENDKRIKEQEARSRDEFYKVNKIPISPNGKEKSSQLLSLIKSL